MTWVTISGAGTTTATKFYGDALNKVANMLNGSDVSDTVSIHSNVIWTYKNGAFKLRNPGDTFSYTIVPAAIVADRSLNLPLITGTDTLAALGLAQSWTATQTFTTPVLGTPTSGTLTNCTGLPLAGLTTDAKTQCIIIAVGDETTVHTTGTSKVKFRIPYAFTLTGIRASLNVAATGGTFTVDVNEGGNTLMSTDKLKFDSTETTTTTYSGTAATLTDTSLADDAEITIDIDDIGTGGVAAGLKVALIGYKT